MNCLKFILSLTLIYILSNCTKTQNQEESSSYVELTDSIKMSLVDEIESMAELDQKYRKVISLGTMDEELLKKDAEMRKTSSIEEYMAFSKTVEKTLTDGQIDSLWELQHALDYQNYVDLKSLISNYGYPSEQRLGIERDLMYPILLHPPSEVGPQNYLDEMIQLLMPEVEEERLSPNKYASFVDNIKTKILNQTQLYGTNKSFNTSTMSVGLPIIDNLEETNKRRTEIGLPELKDGEYELEMD